MTDDALSPPPVANVPPPPPPAAPVRVVRLRELSPKTMWWTAAVIAVLTAGAVVALWWPATAGLNGAELVAARLDGLKIGLRIGVGSGGVIALYLAWRRQHSTEADLDNRERALAHQQEVTAVTMAHQDGATVDLGVVRPAVGRAHRRRTAMSSRSSSHTSREVCRGPELRST